MANKILVCDPIHPDGIAMLKKAGLTVDEKKNLTPEQLQEQIADYDAVVVRGRTKITAPIIEAGDKLKAIARSGVGLDNIDQEAARKRSIKIVFTPAAPTTSVAELTVGMMLNLLRRISYADRAMKDGKWVKSELMGNELKSRTIGIVGAAGRIGLEVARIAVQGFHSNVIGYDVIEFAQKAKEIGFTVVKDLMELLKRSDIVTIHVPYLPSTHHLIDAKAISAMQKGVILVNPSRGDLVDGEALLRAIKAGYIAAAGLDVYHKEPPVDGWEKELTGLPTVVCTPHIGAQTVECQRLESTMVAEQLIQVLAPK